MLIPVIGCLSLQYGIGGKINGLKLGVVNNEVANINDCFNRSLITITTHDFDCMLNKASCRFINDFDTSDADLVCSRIRYKDKQKLNCQILGVF